MKGVFPDRSSYDVREPAPEVFSPGSEVGLPSSVLCLPSSVLRLLAVIRCYFGNAAPKHRCYKLLLRKCKVKTMNEINHIMKLNP
jgi:hypothetical protein